MRDPTPLDALYLQGAVSEGQVRQLRRNFDRNGAASLRSIIIDGSVPLVAGSPAQSLQGCEIEGRVGLTSTYESRTFCASTGLHVANSTSPALGGGSILLPLV